MVEITVDNLNLFDSTELLGIYLYQDFGKIVFANRAFLNMLCFLKEEITKINLLDLVDSEFKKDAENIITSRCKGEVFAHEFKIINLVTKNGMIIPTICFGYTVLYKNKYSGLVFVIDLTREKTFQTLLNITNKIAYISNTILSEDELAKRIASILSKDNFFSHIVIHEQKNKTFKPSLSIGRAEKEFSNMLKKLDKFCGLKEAANGLTPIPLNTLNIEKEGDVHKNTGAYSVCSIPLTVEGKAKYILTIFSKIKDAFSENFKHFPESLHFIIQSAFDKMRTNKINTILNTAINENFDLVVITDKNLTIEYANNQFFKLVEKSRKDVIGSHLEKFIKDIGKLKDEEHGSSQLIKLNLNSRVEPLLLHISKTVLDKKYYIFTAKNIKENSTLFAALENYIKKDQLTGLLNREAMIDSIKKFIERAKYKKLIGALFIIDPVNFSKINEAYGFKVGDKILIEVGNRLVNFLRDYDIVAKLESNRFGVFLKEIEREENIYIVAIRLLNHLSKPYQINGEKINIGFNLGISLYPFDARDPEDLINKAYVALADAKLKGENKIGFYREKLKSSILERLKLREEAEEAMEKREFQLFLQPYFSSSDHSLKGAEALVRWSKNGIVIPPNKFIPVLEQTGLIKKLDIYMVNKVIEFLTQRKAAFPISVNVSPKTLHDEEFVNFLIEKVNAEKLSGLLNIEITERTFLDNLEKTKSVLKLFKNSGIGISIDDFGTGYSSLSYLSQLPVDFLKIDISFVRNILEDEKTLSVVKTIIYLAKQLNITTIAEGVETEKQVNRLKELGCDYLQGFYFSKPIPASQAVVFMESFKVK